MGCECVEAVLRGGLDISEMRIVVSQWSLQGDRLQVFRVNFSKVRLEGVFYGYMGIWKGVKDLDKKKRKIMGVDGLNSEIVDWVLGNLTMVGLGSGVASWGIGWEGDFRRISVCVSLI